MALETKHPEPCNRCGDAGVWVTCWEMGCDDECSLVYECPDCGKKEGSMKEAGLYG